jgi:ribosomal subunit interface protein
MQAPLRITFRHIPQSDALESRIRDKRDKLVSVYPEIVSCDATVEQLDRHRQQGRQFRVSIHAHIPGETLAATADHEDVYVALRDAFTAMRRQLGKAIGTRQDDLKAAPARDVTERSSRGDSAA